MLPSIDPACRAYSTNSEATFTLARKWLEECLRNHRQCASTEDNVLPTRLLDVSSLRESGSVRLVISKELGEVPEFCALSYRWGLLPGTEPLKLTTSNFHDLRREIPATSIPLTIAHALDITQRLGYRYLWVDSLCILQDSAEDFSKEIFLMGKIYKSAVCTISATGAANSSIGCYTKRDPLALLPCHVSGTLYRGCFIRKNDSAIDTESARSNRIDIAPLNKRAWTMQERLLSKRILHFGLNGTLFWECPKMQAYDARPNGDLKDEFHPSEKATSNITEAANRLLNNSGKKATRNPFRQVAAGPSAKFLYEDTSFAKHWQLILEDYTSREITHITDRVPGIAGIATEIEHASGFVFCHGLWMNAEDSIRELLWTVKTNTRTAVIFHYQAPTWSWGSVQGIIEPMFKNYEGLEKWRGNWPPQKIASILDFRAPTITKNAAGQSTHVIDGYLEVECKLVPLNSHDIRHTWCLGYHGDTLEYKYLGDQPTQYFLQPILNHDWKHVITENFREGGKTRSRDWSTSHTLYAGLVIVRNDNDGTYERVGVFNTLDVVTWKLDDLSQVYKSRIFANQEWETYFEVGQFKRATEESQREAREYLDYLDGRIRESDSQVIMLV